VVIQSIVSYKRHRFPPSVIAHAVWLYFRFRVTTGGPILVAMSRSSKRRNPIEIDELPFL
jgi:hypothetical protein